jgi:hypothetical protein
MTPGRELDALVAEKVMGCLSGVSVLDDGRHCLWINRHWVDLLPYSTDIAAAWEVVEKLTRSGWYFELRAPNYLASFFRGIDSHCESIEAPTAPHAICLAALKACDVTTPR